MKPSPPGPDRFYLDTSAYLAIVLAERPAATLLAALGPGAWVSSSLLLIESRRTIINLGRTGEMAERAVETALDRVDQDERRFALRDFTPDLASRQPVPAVRTPRSLDLAHLRTALWFHAASPLKGFVSLDEAQRRSARELALPVLET